MRISTAAMNALPLPAAWLEGETVAGRTPEWTAPTWGIREYRAGRRLRLLVAPAVVEPGIAALCERVLLELQQAVPQTPAPRRAALRLALAALRVIAGVGDADVLTEAQIGEAVVASCAMENRPPRVRVLAAGDEPVAGGWLVAAALKQLAVNAARHEGCAEVTLRSSQGWFALGWPSHAPRTAHQVTTSRHRDRRSGWGLGMVRLACDALGATHLAPHEVAHGTVETALALERESSCLRLPLAMIGPGRVVMQATRTWDLEAGVAPGRPLAAGELATVVDRARHSPGGVVRSGAWAARFDGSNTWVALRPADTREQGLDLLEGLVHEAELLVGEPGSQAWRRATGAVEALQLALGKPQAGWFVAEFLRELAGYGAAYGVDVSAVSGVTTPAPPPALTGFLLAAGGGGQLTPGDGGWIVRVRRPDVAELAGLVGPDGGVHVRVNESSSLQEAG